MASFNDCVPGSLVRVLNSGVPRVRGRTGVLVEVSRSRRAPTDPLVERVTVDIPGHGDVVLAPADVEIVAGT
jgi:hypothetical protein